MFPDTPRKITLLYEVTILTPSKGHDVGYIRVSSFSQNTDRQLDGIELEKIYEEKASAKDAKRPILQECIAYLRGGDCLHVHSIDRLARNLMDLQSIVTDLNSKSISVTFHKENLTFTGNGDNPMNKLMLQMMGAFAEFERALIKERQREGIIKAQQKGIRFGRKPVLTSDQVKEIRKRVAGGESKSTLAKEYSISRQTLYTALADLEKQQDKESKKIPTVSELIKEASEKEFNQYGTSSSSATLEDGTVITCELSQSHSRLKSGSWFTTKFYILHPDKEFRSSSSKKKAIELLGE
jgi:DNA invertase Pin-like site-specific DNA recombinase